MTRDFSARRCATRMRSATPRIISATCRTSRSRPTCSPWPSTFSTVRPATSTPRASATATRRRCLRTSRPSRPVGPGAKTNVCGAEPDDQSDGGAAPEHPGGQENAATQGRRRGPGAQTGVSVMRTTMTPPLAPSRNGTVYLVLDDFGEFGRAYRETQEAQADRQTVLADLLSGQYERPLRIVAFNTAEGWAHDVSAEIAREREMLVHAGESELPLAVRDFVERAA